LHNNKRNAGHTIPIHVQNRPSTSPTLYPSTTHIQSADITAKTLTVSATGANKAYDGTTTTTVTLADNRVAGDVLTTSYTSAAFADKNVGTAKAASVNVITLTRTDSRNYTFNTTTSAT